jgi:hypothetical protein
MLAIACGLIAWLAVAWRRAERQRADVHARHVAALRAQSSRDKTAAEALAASRTQVREIRQDLSSQRKKNHALQQALRAAELRAGDERQQRLDAQHIRPAFAEPEPELPPAPRPRQAAQAVLPAAAAPAAAPARGPSELALQAELAVLRRQHAEAQVRLATAQSQAADSHQTIQRLQKRCEDMRRIDLISRAQLELLEDKLRARDPRRKAPTDSRSAAGQARGAAAPPQADAAS